MASLSVKRSIVFNPEQGYRCKNASIWQSRRSHQTVILDCYTRPKMALLLMFKVASIFLWSPIRTYKCRVIRPPPYTHNPLQFNNTQRKIFWPSAPHLHSTHTGGQGIFQGRNNHLKYGLNHNLLLYLR